MHVCICSYIRGYICICIRVYIRVYIRICIRICIHICTFLHLFIHILLYIITIYKSYPGNHINYIFRNIIKQQAPLIHKKQPDRSRGNHRVILLLSSFTLYILFTSFYLIFWVRKTQYWLHDTLAQRSPSYANGFSDG